MHQPHNIYLVIENPWNLWEIPFLFIGSCYTISCYIKELRASNFLPKDEINFNQLTLTFILPTTLRSSASV